MCIKILIYMIDNQQVKSKISIIFSARWSFAVLFPSLRRLGGAGQKRQLGRADFGGGGPSRIPPTYPHISYILYQPILSFPNNLTHIINFIIFAI